MDELLEKIETLKEDAELLLGIPLLEKNLERIRYEFERAQIKYEYDYMKEILPYGSGSDIKEQLANKYNKSVKTIERYVHY